jgi:gamma-glutamyl-gamma-aminobutyrate hydrolase PuuD
MPTITTTQSDVIKPVKVIFAQESLLEYPQMWCKVYIEGEVFEQAQFAEMLIKAHCTKAHTPDEADMVFFTGGADVNPLLYGEKPHSQTKYDDARDARDMELYEKCLKEGIPMIGICRGAQFLHVMNGGKLFQHVDNHYGDHDMWDLRQRKLIKTVSSVHHQMIMPGTTKNIEIIAHTSSVSKNRWVNDKDVRVGGSADIEAFFYRDSCCLGIQGHPEYRTYDEFTKWSLDTILSVVYENPDTKYVDKKLRIDPEILSQREALQAGKMN